MIAPAEPVKKLFQLTSRLLKDGLVRLDLTFGLANQNCGADRGPLKSDGRSTPTRSRHPRHPRVRTLGRWFGFVRPEPTESGVPAAAKSCGAVLIRCRARAQANSLAPNRNRNLCSLYGLDRPADIFRHGIHIRLRSRSSPHRDGAYPSDRWLRQGNLPFARKGPHGHQRCQ
jgi:hypothetical protein